MPGSILPTGTASKVDETQVTYFRWALSTWQTQGGEGQREGSELGKRRVVAEEEEELVLVFMDRTRWTCRRRRNIVIAFRLNEVRWWWG